MEFIEEKTFTQAYLPQKAQFELCIFEHCQWEQQDLSAYKFTECIFINCNLSLCDLQNTQFQDVKFIGCKMLGLSFQKLSNFSMDLSFDNCLLDHSLFTGRNWKKTNFNNCSLKEVDFQESDLTEVSFNQCNLDRALFYHSNLHKADFRTAQNFQIQPENNKMKGAKFSIEGLLGLLAHYQIKVDNA